MSMDEGRIFLYALCLGFIFATIYGTIMIVRENLKLKDKIINETFGVIEDFLFAILVYFFLYNYILTFNQGVIRLYIFLGVIAGVVINFLTFYKFFKVLVRKTREMISNKIKQIQSKVIGKIEIHKAKVKFKKDQREEKKIKDMESKSERGNKNNNKNNNEKYTKYTKLKNS